MVSIAPFRGIIYKRRAVPDLAEVVAPPYDVISAQEQSALYDRSGYNAVRLILGREFENDNGASNRYTRASAYLKNWMDEGTLGPCEEPALYLYAQDYEIGGRMRRRVGFICRLGIEPFGDAVFRHERTLSGPKQDRLKLTRACRMNLSPVFGLYADPGRRLDALWETEMSLPPALEVGTGDGIVHRMWFVTDEETIRAAVAFLADKPVVIADGHHRYETALDYRDERRAQEAGPAGAPYDYVMMYLSNIHGQGFTVLPTHRIVKKIGDVDMASLSQVLSGDFTIEEHRVTDENAAGFIERLARASARGPSFGMYTGAGNITLLTLKEDVAGRLRGSGAGADLVNILDVTILQELIFEKALKISREAVTSKEAVSYTIRAGEAMDAVDSGQARLAFLMNSTGIDQVMEVATHGGVMPQKSTYFYPKLLTGLVFNPLS